MIIMSKSFLATICAVLCAGLVFSASSCRKNSNGRGTVTITGKLLQDCSGTPIAKMPLDFYLKSHNTMVGGESGIIGHTMTDSEGNFSVTGTNFGDGGLSVYQDFNDPKGHRFVYDYTISGGNGSIINLGNVYYMYDVSLAVKFQR